MIKIYPPPPYYGKEFIQTLLDSVEESELSHAARPHQSYKYFNAEGYAVPLANVNGKPWVVIRKVPNKHEFLFFFDESDLKTTKIPRLKLATKMKDHDQQQSLMHTLYYDPLYHDPDIYKEQADKIASEVTYKNLLTKEMYLEKIKKLYQEATELQMIMKQGQRTFGCQRRYYYHGTNVLKALNRTSIDANHKCWKSIKRVLQYPGEKESDAYELKEISIPEFFFEPPSKHPSLGQKAVDGKKWYHRVNKYACLEANAIYQLCEMRTDRPSYERTLNKQDLLTLFKYVIWGLEIRERLKTTQESQDFHQQAFIQTNNVFEMRDHFLEEYSKLFTKYKSPLDEFLNFLDLDNAQIK